ncbi:cell division protein FtsZ [Patescibacteria group bacterium]|nr:cell division protein FtsZ [Patescibacteria group bacterium]
MNIPKIKVIGIGGAGCNTISRMADSELKGVDLIAVNTDAQALKQSKGKYQKILIGQTTTGGLGTGMDYRLGEKAAQESKEKIKEVLTGVKMVFLTCGLGGGTGSSGIPILAEIAKNLGALTIAIVTSPFSFEGSFRQKVANWGLLRLENKVDSLLCIPNDRILKVIGRTTSVRDAFLRCDEVLSQAVKGISDLISSPGIISVDFADMEEILKDSGRALFGVGQAKGENRAIAAASSALQSPLLDFSVKRAGGILFNISGEDLTLFEVNSVANFIKKISWQKTKIIFGVSEDKTLDKGEIKVRLIATGIE